MGIAVSPKRPSRAGALTAVALSAVLGTAVPSSAAPSFDPPADPDDQVLVDWRREGERDPAGEEPRDREREPRHGAAQVLISPISPRPGTDVDVRVKGCREQRGTAHSEAFVSEVPLAPAADGGLFGEARISSSIEPGSYDVEATCGREPLDARGRVVVAEHGRGEHGKDGRDKQEYDGARQEHDRGGHAAGHDGEAGPRHADGRDGERKRPEPTAPVKAGGGGSALAAEGGGPGAWGPALTGAGVLLGAGVLVARRRARSRAR